MATGSIVEFTFWSLKTCIEIIYVPIRFFRLFKQPKKCPPIIDHILLLRAEELAEKIRQQQVRAVNCLSNKYFGKIGTTLNRYNKNKQNFSENNRVQNY